MEVTILVLLELTLQQELTQVKEVVEIVTILVLLELTLQYKKTKAFKTKQKGHNPCFIRINFAILIDAIKNIDEAPVTILVLLELTLQFYLILEE